MPLKQLRLPSAALKDARGFNKRSSPFFIVRLKKNQAEAQRVAVIVGAKTAPSSAARHLIKRRVREHLRSILSAVDVMVTVLPAVKGLSKKELLEKLEQLLK